jgi:hypothetical protein
MVWSQEVQALSLPATCIALGVAAAGPGASAIRTVRTAAQAHNELRALLEQGRSDDDGAFWDGGPAQRIAMHLRRWLRRQAPAGPAAAPFAEVSSFSPSMRHA